MSECGLLHTHVHTEKSDTDRVSVRQTVGENGNKKKRKNEQALVNRKSMKHLVQKKLLFGVSAEMDVTP